MVPAWAYREMLATVFDRFLNLGAPDEASGFAGRVRAAQIAAVRRYTPWMMIANIANALLVTVCFFGTPYLPAIALWATVVILIAAFALIRGWPKRSQPARAIASKRGIRRSVIHALLLGGIWAVLPGFFAVGDMEQRAIIAAVVAGMMCGSGFALATIAPAAIAFAGMLALGSTMAVILAPGFTTMALLALNSIYLAVILVSALSLARTLRERIEAQIRSEEQRDYISLLLSDFEEHGTDWLWMIDHHGRVQHVSSRLTERLHMSEAELIGRRALACLPLPPRATRSEDERRQLSVLMRAMKARQTFRDLELTVEIDGWPQRWALTAKPIFGLDGHFEGYRGIGRNVTEASVARRRMEHLARFDVLTGLANRATLMDHLERGFARVRRKGGGFALLLIDLDHFKSINDTQGHPVGDELLVEAARRLQALVGDDDVVARLGGDEFAIVIEGEVEPERVGAMASRTIRALAHPFELSAGVVAQTGASIGIAAADPHGDPTALIRHADLALYRAKHGGRNRFAFFEPAFEASAQRRHRLERDLRDALDAGILELAFQPIADATNLRISSCEALVRWTHPQFGPVSPAEFVAIAEESGLIGRLGQFVVEAACRAALAWPEHVRVAVNLSPVEFRSPALFACVRHALEVTGLAPDRLELEITESLFLEQGGHVDATLLALRRLGVRIALDDFGVGYSSLSYLRRYQFDKLKIDRSFVQGLAEGPQSPAIIAAVVAMAGNLETAIAAEGVETAQQLETLRSLGCGLIQGYFIGRPMPADAMTTNLWQSLDRPRSGAA